MEPLEYLMLCQSYWALRRGITLTPQGSTLHLANNLFVPLSPGALHDLGVNPGQQPDPRLRAVHGGAAKTLNVFDYWKHSQSFQEIGVALGLAGNPPDVYELAFGNRLAA
jgi:hypothetical protein